MIRVIALILTFSVVTEIAGAQTSTDALHQLFDETWTAELADDPLNATNIGVHDHDNRLPDVSPTAIAARTLADQQALERLHKIDRDGLNEDDKLNYDLFEHRLDQRLSTTAFKLWRIPFTSDSGFHTELAYSIEATPFETVADYDAFIERLSAVPSYIDQQIANMRQGLSEGFSQPQAILSKVEPTFAALDVAGADESVFFEPFESLPDRITPSESARIKQEGKRIVNNEVLPAFAKLHRFFVDEYIPGARTTLGANAVDNGDAYYQSQVAYYTTLDLTPAEIHEIGLQEAERIRARMRQVMADVEFEGSLQDFFDFLRTDPQFYAKSAKELMREAAWIAKRIDEVMPAYFGTLPRMSYGVRAVPDDIAPNYTTGRYWSSIPGKRGGLFMVNTYELDRRPLYNLPALALHEGVPGHHHQISIALELDGLPEFRKHTYVNAFGEGWGLYSEYLGEEMGIYETPYDQFGRLTYEMWRAGRLVVDTGIHAMGWSRQEAIDFFMQNSALSEHNINTEVDRYISWPGQALGYKMGELTILDLRRRAEAALGDNFDVRSFHDAVLENGALPLPVLEQQIEAYIAEHLEISPAKN